MILCSDGETWGRRYDRRRSVLFVCIHKKTGPIFRSSRQFCFPGPLRFRGFPYFAPWDRRCFSLAPAFPRLLGEMLFPKNAPLIQPNPRFCFSLPLLFPTCFSDSCTGRVDDTTGNVTIG